MGREPSWTSLSRIAVVKVEVGVRVRLATLFGAFLNSVLPGEGSSDSLNYLVMVYNSDLGKNEYIFER